MGAIKVTCIMPCSRPDDLPRAIEQFIAQDYKKAELCILMDEQNYTKDTSIKNRIYQWGMPGSIGFKRNHLCHFAKGDIIIHMDSDDYYAPDWITRSITALGDNDMTGLRHGYFYNTATGIGKYYHTNTPQPYVLGATMCYRKRIWEANPFPENVQFGEDAAFMAHAGRVVNHDYIDGFAAIIHGNNTCSHMAFQTMKVVDRNIIPYVKRYG